MNSTFGGWGLFTLGTPGFPVSRKMGLDAPPRYPDMSVSGSETRQLRLPDGLSVNEGTWVTLPSQMTQARCQLGDHLHSSFCFKRRATKGLWRGGSLLS